MKYNILLVFISIALAGYGCDKDDKGQTNCDQQTIINQSEFENAPTDDLSISNMEITRHCLKISFSASGCDGSTWNVKLIDSGALIKTYPPKRSLILSLENKEDCEAVISKEVSFDIGNLQVSGYSVGLIIVNTGDEILYEY